MDVTERTHSAFARNQGMLCHEDMKTYSWKKTQNYGADILVAVLVCTELEKEKTRKPAVRKQRVFLRTGFPPGMLVLDY